MKTASRDQISNRLLEIYRRSKELIVEGTAGKPITATPFDLAKYGDDPPPTRLESVKTAAAGLEYAAWCIGEAVLLGHGPDALCEVFKAFEQMTDARGSSWLDHRWNGVSDGRFTWTA